jgi:ribosomal-protein-alanine N-acetyltransferase
LLPTVLDTPRLRLVPNTASHYVALMQGTHAFERSFGLPAAEGLGTFARAGDVSSVRLERTRASLAHDPWLHGFVVVERESQSAIGFLGFEGSSDIEGVVEIAYGIVPTFQGRGLATEALGIAVAFAFAHAAVGCLRAQTLPANAASGRVLAKGGFTYIGEVDDPEDGRVGRWELTRAAAGGAV